jgi:periplasmic protein TonB
MALYLILMLPPIKTPAKKVVQVDAITLAAVTPQPEGGHAGGSGGAPATPEPPKTVPKPPPPPKPPELKPKPKPVVKPPPPPLPEPDPIPPRLAMPKPASPVIPPRPAQSTALASSSSRLGTSSGSSLGQGAGSGPGTGTGSGTGVGSGRGYGTGIGTGTGSGAGSGSALQGYLHQVRSLLERNKIYPPLARSRNEQGTVVVRFTISSDGSIGGVSLSRPSGYSALDQAAQETVSRVGRFPPIPTDVQKPSLRIEVPLSFRLQGG